MKRINCPLFCLVFCLSCLSLVIGLRDPGLALQLLFVVFFFLFSYLLFLLVMAS